MRNVVLVLMASCLVLTGCSTSAPVDIDGEDNDARFSEAEIAVRIGDDQDQRVNRGYAAISVGYTHSEGQFNQSLSSGESVRLDSGSIDGPAMLDNEASLDVTYVRVIYHSFMSESFEWYGAGGLGYLDMELTTTSGTQRIKDSDSQLNIHALLGLAYHFTPAFGIEGNISFYPPIFPFSNSASLVGERIQFFVSPTDTLRLFAGYRRWTYSFEDNDSVFARSDVNLDFSGPTAGVTLSF